MASSEPAESWPPETWIEVGDDGAAALVGGYSPTSRAYHFPIGPLCPYTGADDVERVVLSSRGTLFSWTAVTAAPPGYEGEVPYGFGVVELTTERLRVIGRLTEADPGALTFGQEMQVVVESLADGHPIWAFTPVADGAGA